MTTAWRSEHDMVNLQVNVPTRMRNRLNTLTQKKAYASRSALILEALEVFCEVLEAE